MSNLKVTYKDVSPEAKELSTAVAEDKQDFVDMSQLKQDDLIIPRYITLEDKLVALDDNNHFINDSDTIFGYISETMSNEEGTFEEPVVITRTFEENVTSVGVTMNFSNYFNNYCNNLNIKWYNSEELLSDKDFEPNNYIYFCQNNVEYFNKMVITFNSTNNPYRYLKIAQIDDGVVRIFEDDEIRSLKIVEELNPISEEVSINTMTLNLDSLKDIEFLFQKKQKMQVDFKDELVGIYYIETSKQKSAKQHIINLEDYVGLLDKSYFYGGIYAGVEAQTIIASIMQNEIIEYTLEENLKTIELNGYIPICTKREALQQVLFAINGIVDTSRSDKLNIYTLKEDDELIEVEENKTYMGATYTTGDTITKVKLTEHKYIENNDLNDLYDDTLDGTVRLEFNEPYHTYNITGGTIDEYNTNYAVITGTGSSVLLTAKGYTHNTLIKTALNPKTTAGTIPKEVSYDGATLISASNSASVLANISSHLFRKDKIQVQLELENNEGTGDRLGIATEYKGSKNARVESVTVDLKNKFIGKVVATIE